MRTLISDKGHDLPWYICIRTPCEGKRKRGDVTFPTVIGAEYKVVDPERLPLSVKISGFVLS